MSRRSSGDGSVEEIVGRQRIEGYAIVSEDGMLANAAGIMPDSLKFEADQLFFERRRAGWMVDLHELEPLDLPRRALSGEGRLRRGCRGTCSVAKNRQYPLPPKARVAPCLVCE
jgi:hypothetical protein